MADMEITLGEANSNGKSRLWCCSDTSDPVVGGSALLMADMALRGWAGNGEANAQSKGGETQEMHGENDDLEAYKTEILRC